LGMFTSYNFCSTCHMIQNMEDVIIHIWLMPSNKTVMPKSNFVRTRHTGHNFRPWYVRTIYIPHSWSFEFFSDEKWGEICTGLGRLQSSYISYGGANVLRTDLENSWSHYLRVTKSLMLILVTANFVLSRHRRSI
jgi:hypothetical protein